MTRSTEPEAIMSRILGWAWVTLATFLASTPAAFKASQVPEVARISMPISARPRAIPTISPLSSSLTVRMTRLPFLGTFMLAPLKAFSSAWG